VSLTHIPADLRRLVESRAGSRCECCLLSSTLSFFPHEVDHVIAEKHGGRTEAENLALACWRCNRHKGSDLGSFDPLTGEFSLLFNPRAHTWSEHFALEGETLVGLTAQGRTTIRLLRLDNQERLAERRRLQGI